MDSAPGAQDLHPAGGLHHLQDFPGGEGTFAGIEEQRQVKAEEAEAQHGVEPQVCLQPLGIGSVAGLHHRDGQVTRYAHRPEGRLSQGVFRSAARLWRPSLLL